MNREGAKGRDIGVVRCGRILFFMLSFLSPSFLCGFHFCFVCVHFLFCVRLCLCLCLTGLARWESDLLQKCSGTRGAEVGLYFCPVFALFITFYFAARRERLYTQ